MNLMNFDRFLKVLEQKEINYAIARQYGRSSLSLFCDESISDITKINIKLSHSGINKNMRIYNRSFLDLYPDCFRPLYPNRIKQYPLYKIEGYYYHIKSYNKLVKLKYIGKYPPINIVKNLPEDFHYYIKYNRYIDYIPERKKYGYKTL